MLLRVRIPGQRHGKSRATSGFGLHLDVSVMALENAVADGQSEARLRVQSLWL